MAQTKIILRQLILLFVVALFFAPRSAGFCYQPDPTIACQFLNSDAVFVGTVVSAHKIPPPSEREDDGWLYTLTVQEVFRGPQRAKVAVFTENNTSRFPLDAGKQYLLFASKFHGHLVIRGCGNSALFSDSEMVIRELRNLRVPDEAMIEGRISFSGIPDDGTHVAGFRVVVRGQGKKYTATSDENGWFHLRVPPGEYSAEFEENPPWKITPYDLSFDWPMRFIARKGHCSGLQFQANPK